MLMTVAEQLSIKNLINAFLRESHAVFHNNENSVLMKYELQPFGFELQIPVTYYSITGRHQYNFSEMLLVDKNSQAYPVHPWGLIGLLMQDLQARHPKAQSGHREFIQRFFNSCENMSQILQYLKREEINQLFESNVDFKLAENGLITGHQMHPCPKSREGFTKKEFECYSPELKNEFQLHYFIADPTIVLSHSDLTFDANQLVREHLLTETIKENGIIIPLHPWQAKHIQSLPVIKKLIEKNQLKDLGQLGHAFTATTSVRTVYSLNSVFMAKLSLNVHITNSMRVQYKKELLRGIAAHQFWNSEVGKTVKAKYTSFNVITDPAFLCLKDGDHIIDETASLLRLNPFTHSNNNTTPLATLCQDHPFKSGNRFNSLIPIVAHNKQLTLKEAALTWFNQFLVVAIEPLLWIFVHYGVAIEAHQQNLLIKIADGLPIKSYYRDNQGYYITKQAYSALGKTIDTEILKHFCKGTDEFISHHFTYYLICNSVFGIINALGTAGLISETKLLSSLAHFIRMKKQEWNTDNLMLTQLLAAETLPFKGNLLTRFYNLDELTAPLQQQSVYLEIDNLIKSHHQSEQLL